MMEPFDDSFYQDRCQIGDPVLPTDVDADNAPLNTQAPAIDAPLLPCSVQRNTSTYQETTRVGDPAPSGATKRTIRFNQDPGVVQTGQILRFYENANGAFSDPILYAAHGPAEPPVGIGAGTGEWRVDVTAMR